MCELFGLSASGATRAEGPLRNFRLRGGSAADNPDGWGLAYRDNAVFHVFKEPLPAAQSVLFAELCDTARSDLIVAHVRKARHPPVNTMTNTHPFKHACCGKEWVFAHNGLVPDIVDLELGSENPVCRPTGQTERSVGRPRFDVPRPERSAEHSCCPAVVTVLPEVSPHEPA